MGWDEERPRLIEVIVYETASYYPCECHQTKKSTAPQQATTIKQQTNLRPPTSDESEKPEARHKGIILIRGARARREHHLEKDS